jgi:hypothetical protein
MDRRDTKKFLPPLILGLVLLGILFWNWRLSVQNRELQSLLARTTARIESSRAALEKLHHFEQQQQHHQQYRLDDWIPRFRNTVQARLYISRLIREKLDAATAHLVRFDWSTPDISKEKTRIDIFLTADFPSYRALQTFVTEIERHVPPLLVQGAQMTKKNIRLETSLVMCFGYRLEHGAL